MTRYANLRWFLVLTVLSIAAWSAGNAPGLAQSAGNQSSGDAGAASQPAAAPKFDAADNAWVLTSAALVLFMTAPALALFYSGLVRKKNVLNVMMQCVCLMCLMTVLWALFGYSLVFGGDGPWIGDGRYLLMNGVNAVWTSHGSEVPLYPGLTIPVMTHMLFQGMFFIITPALICGAFAERMRFSAMVAFTSLWGILIYCPLAHWIWGGGILAYGSPHAAEFSAGGALDFAGGTVVHISSGVSALVAALYLGKRVGYPDESMKPHNLTLSFIGACMLWVGWFGFNAGSALAASPLATSAFVATHFATATAVLGWLLMEWVRNGKPSVLGGISGAVAGLVAITPASGFVTPMAALLIGFLAGIACYFMVSVVKQKLGYDDTLDAFGVHGIGGTLGAILTGVFATRLVNDGLNGKPLGLVDGNPFQVLNQCFAVLISWGMAAVGTLVILKICDLLLGVRVNTEQEEEGLDLSLHGEEGYNLEA